MVRNHLLFIASTLSLVCTHLSGAPVFSKPLAPGVSIEQAEYNKKPVHALVQCFERALDLPNGSDGQIRMFRLLAGLPSQKEQAVRMALAEKLDPAIVANAAQALYAAGASGQ